MHMNIIIVARGSSELSLMILLHYFVCSRRPVLGESPGDDSQGINVHRY